MSKVCNKVWIQRPFGVDSYIFNDFKEGMENECFEVYSWDTGKSVDENKQVCDSCDIVVFMTIKNVKWLDDGSPSFEANQSYKDTLLRLDNADQIQIGVDNEYNVYETIHFNGDKHDHNVTFSLMNTDSNLLDWVVSCRDAMYSDESENDKKSALTCPVILDAGFFTPLHNEVGKCTLARLGTTDDGEMRLFLQSGFDTSVKPYMPVKYERSIYVYQEADGIWLPASPGANHPDYEEWWKNDYTSVRKANKFNEQHGYPVCHQYKLPDFKEPEPFPIEHKPIDLISKPIMTDRFKEFKDNKIHQPFFWFDNLGNAHVSNVGKDGKDISKYTQIFILSTTGEYLVPVIESRKRGCWYKNNRITKHIKAHNQIVRDEVSKHDAKELMKDVDKEILEGIEIPSGDYSCDTKEMTVAECKKEFDLSEYDAMKLILGKYAPKKYTGPGLMEQIKTKNVRYYKPLTWEEMAESLNSFEVPTHKYCIDPYCMKSKSELLLLSSLSSLV